MPDLLFTPNGELREAARDDRPHAIARIAEAREGSCAKLVCDASEHEIVICAESGGAFELRDREGRAEGGFMPFRLRRGGHLRAGEVTMALRGKPLIHDGWTFSWSEGRTVDATLNTAGHEATATDSVEGVILAPSFAVSLELDEPAALPELAATLALGCWVIVRWHRALAGERVFAAARLGREQAKFN